MNFPTPVFVLIFLMVVVEVSLFSCASISFPSKQDHFRTAKTNAKNADRQNNNVLVNKNVHDTAAFNAAQEAGLIDQKSPDKEIYSVPIGTSHFNRSLIGSHRRLLLGISHLFGNQESPLFATSQRLERANTVSLILIHWESKLSSDLCLFCNSFPLQIPFSHLNFVLSHRQPRKLFY